MKNVNFNNAKFDKENSVSEENFMEYIEKEEIGRTIEGEKIEYILLKIFKEYGFEAEIVDYGKDLVLTLKKKHKFIFSYKTTIKYSIEVKSILGQNTVSMTPNEAGTSIRESSAYALCVVPKDGSIINEDYIKKHTKFVVDIGYKLKNVVDTFEMGCKWKDGDIFYGDIFYDQKRKRFKISSIIWGSGINFDGFIKYIMEKWEKH